MRARYSVEHALCLDSSEIAVSAFDKLICACKTDFLINLKVGAEDSLVADELNENVLILLNTVKRQNVLAVVGVFGDCIFVVFNITRLVRICRDGIVKRVADSD